MGRKFEGGVERRDTSLRIKFEWAGELCRETLTLNGKPLPPTPANYKYALRLSADIRKAIERGSFEYATFFPDSDRGKLEAKANTFGALADQWLLSKGHKIEGTRDQYATAVRFWKRLLGEHTPISQLTDKVLKAKIGGHDWPSAKTHNNYMIALRGVMDFEYSGRRAIDNPMNGIKNLKVIKKLPDPFTIAEREAILDALRKRYDVRIYAYFLFMFFTGMRPEEAIALRWSDLDSDKGVCRIRRVRTFRGGERDGSKTNSERDVDLVDPALHALDLMKPFTFMLRTERDGEDDTSANIFQNPVTGKPWHDERSQRDHYWRPTLKALGIRWRKPYNTRHTYCTVSLMGRVNPAYIAAQAGHSLKMLLEVYARWIPANDEAGEERARLAAAQGGSRYKSLENPQKTATSAKPLILKGFSGRSDRIRTNP